MDEANVFFSGIISATDERLTTVFAEQKANAILLRLFSIISGIVIVIVIGTAAVTVVRYTRELRRARTEVSVLNAGLEQRVEARTADLAARERRYPALCPDHLARPARAAGQHCRLHRRTRGQPGEPAPACRPLQCQEQRRRSGPAGSARRGHRTAARSDRIYSLLERQDGAADQCRPQARARRTAAVESRDRSISGRSSPPARRRSSINCPRPTARSISISAYPG